MRFLARCSSSFLSPLFLVIWVSFFPSLSVLVLIYLCQHYLLNNYDASRMFKTDSVYLAFRMVCSLDVSFREMRTPEVSLGSWRLYLYARRYDPTRWTVFSNSDTPVDCNEAIKLSIMPQFFMGSFMETRYI
jgi:hypothetical protein